MAGFLINYANNETLEEVFGGSALRSLAPLSLGLSTWIVVKSGEVSDPSNGGSSRSPIVNDLTNYPFASGETKSNGETIASATPPANWDTVATVFIADAATGGNGIASAERPVSKAINSGASVPTIAVGALFLSHS